MTLMLFFAEKKRKDKPSQNIARSKKLKTSCTLLRLNILRFWTGHNGWHDEAPHDGAPTAHKNS